MHGMVCTVMDDALRERVSLQVHALMELLGPAWLERLSEGPAAFVVAVHQQHMQREHWGVPDPVCPVCELLMTWSANHAAFATDPGMGFLAMQTAAAPRAGH